ncbi:hypothetical protein OIU78_001824 [Salix suchowensis]|nr:hypothetical protein OIU78_001824 [Salix suchowensis]
MDDHMVEATSKSSWTIIDKIASTPNSLAFLSEKFKALEKISIQILKAIALKIVFANQAKKLEPDRGGVGSSVWFQWKIAGQITDSPAIDSTIIFSNELGDLTVAAAALTRSRLNQMGLILNHRRLFLKKSSELKDCLAQTYTAAARPKSSLNP